MARASFTAFVTPDGKLHPYTPCRGFILTGQLSIPCALPGELAGIGHCCRQIVPDSTETVYFNGGRGGSRMTRTFEIVGMVKGADGVYRMEGERVLLHQIVEQRYYDDETEPCPINYAEV